MGDEGLVADNQMLSSVARAVSIAQGGSAALSETAGSPRLSDILVTSPRRNSVTAGTSSSLLRIVPSDVWVMQDWQWAQHAKNTLYRRKYVNSSADGSVNSNSRSMTAATYHRPSVTQLNTTSKDPIKFLQVPDSSNKSTKGTPVGIDRFVEWLLGSNNNATSPRDSSTASTPKSAVESDKMPSLTGVFGQSSRPPLARRPSRGLNLKTVEFPRLKWKWAPHETFDQSSIHWASKKLSRQVAVAENLLVGMFPSLCIDLQNPLGMSCPSPTCQLKRTLTLEEVYEGWGDDGDPNKYTTKCPNCGHAFVPRFTVMCRSKSWVGSEGPKTPLWCEFLSPWTLRKELFTVLFEEGVEHVISPSFRHPILSPQHCVLFWNALISFRLQGLPYSFLLCGRSITSAFPPLSSSVSAAGAPGSSSSTVDKVIPYVSPVMRS